MWLIAEKIKDRSNRDVAVDQYHLYKIQESQNFNLSTNVCILSMRAWDIQHEVLSVTFVNHFTFNF